MRALVITGILATTLLMSGCFHRRHHGGHYNTGHGYNTSHGYNGGHGGYDSHGNAVVYDEHGGTVVDGYGNVIVDDHD